VTVLIRAVLAADPTIFLTEDFQSDPASRGWRVSGDPALFRWDAGAGQLNATWDSSRPNTYFHLPLQTQLTRDDDFAFSFALELQDINVGTTPGKPYTFELAVGFVNLAQATGPGFWRGTGLDSPNLVEWDYFPDSGFGATLSPTIISAQGQFATAFLSPYELPLGEKLHFIMEYLAAQRRLLLTVNVPDFAPIVVPVKLGPAFDDFAVDAFAISSYSDAGQNPDWSGSVLAHGTMDDVTLRLPAPPIRRFTGRVVEGVWQTQFTGWLGWRYTLESSRNLRDWSLVGSPLAGTGTSQTLADPQPLLDHLFYRVRADKL
jgi:hypothetical protein